VPEGDTVIEESWSLCPLSLGAYGNFECIDTGCEFCLYQAGEPEAGTQGTCSPQSCKPNCFDEVEEERATGNCEAVAQSAWRPTLSVSPWDYFLSCFNELSGEGSLPGGLGPPQDETVPESVEVLFRYTVRTDAGQSREALVRVPFSLGGPSENINRAPTVLSVSVNGEPLACGDVLPAAAEGDKVEFKIEIDDESLDMIPTSDGLSERKEDVFASYYCTAGRFEKPVTDGLVMESSWEARRLEEEQTEANIHIVVRDEQGGQAVLGPYKIPLATP